MDKQDSNMAAITVGVAVSALSIAWLLLSSKERKELQMGSPAKPDQRINPWGLHPGEQEALGVIQKEFERQRMSGGGPGHSIVTKVQRVLKDHNLPASRKAALQMVKLGNDMCPAMFPGRWEGWIGGPTVY